MSEWRHRHPAFTSLLGRCREIGARLLLVRRLHRDPGSPRRWAVADARPGREVMRWGSFEDDAELADLDPVRPGGTPSGDPALLVCTHGRRDACCAQRGWPVVSALTDAYPEWTWQCSHVGGDRFAANLVVLPHGLYHGRVVETSAEEVVQSYRAGRIEPATFRGRSCFPTAVQTAQHHARAALGIDAVDALAPLRLERLADGAVEVVLEGRVRVVVVPRESPPIERLTCAAVGSSSIVVWELRTLEGG